MSMDSSMVCCCFSSFFPRLAAGEDPGAALRFAPAAGGELWELGGLESGCDCEDASRADLRVILLSDDALASTDGFENEFTI